jgi:hypothetical protein
VLLRVHRSSHAIVVIGDVDVVSRLWVVLRLPYIPQFVLRYATVVTVTGPFVLLRRATCRNQLL